MRALKFMDYYGYMKQLIKKLLGNTVDPDDTPLANDTSDLHDADAPLLCAVANVVAERPYGPGGAETRIGSKHFASNTKVYVVDYYWGAGAEDVTVIGHHRKSRRLITVVMKSELLVEWRVQPIHKPEILRMTDGQLWNGVLKDKARLQKIVDSFNQRD